MDTSSKPTIFISYRKKDTEFISGRLYDTLITHFAEDQVFMDYEDLEGGVDFEEAIEKMLESCDIMLAVIGPNWIGANEDGSPRIMNEKDWVRLELSTALKRNVRVIPVLVEGAAVPTEESMPPDLHNLRRKQTVELNNRNWRTDTEKLIRLLEKLVGSPSQKNLHTPTIVNKPGSIWYNKRKWAFAVVALIGLIFIINALIGGKPDGISGHWVEPEGYSFRVYQEENDSLSGSLFYKHPDSSKAWLLSNLASGQITNRKMYIDFYQYTDEGDTIIHKIDGNLTRDGSILQTTFTFPDQKKYDMDFEKQKTDNR